MYFSLDESIPLCKVLSPLSSAFVEERLLSEIAEEIGTSWREIARKLSKDDYLLAGIDERFPEPEDASLAASEFLNRWFETRDKAMMMCELYDILCDVGLASLAVKKFQSHMMPDAASGLLEEPLMLLSDRVTPDVIRVVADIGSAKWREIGRRLKFAETELAEYERWDTIHEKLYQVLHDWTDRARNASVGMLLKVCDKVKIGGRVRIDLKSIFVGRLKLQFDVDLLKELKKRGLGNCTFPCQ